MGADQKIFKCKYNTSKIRYKDLVLSSFKVKKGPVHYLKTYGNRVLHAFQHLIKYTRKA